MQYLHTQRISGKKIFSVISAFVMSLCFVVSSSSTSDNTGMILSAEATDGNSIYDEYLSWSQLDERWGNTSMGYTNIRSSGCLLTSLAIMAVHSDSIDDAAMANMGISNIEEFNPGVLADAYTSVNGFTSGGAIASWLTVEQLIPQIEWGKDDYFASTEKSAVADEIRAMTNDGWHIIARVANGGFHWVYIQGVTDDDNIIMCDPAKTETELYSAYPEGLQGEYWMLKGKNPPSLNKENNGENNTDIEDNTYISGDEYFVQTSEPVEVYSEIESGSVTATLTPGSVINISEYNGTYGLLETSNFTGWVDISLLSATAKVQQITGDINNDGTVDKYDIALLNTYLQQKELLPDGVSTLSTAELKAADINCDGVVNSGDVIAYIKAINS